MENTQIPFSTRSQRERSKPDQGERKPIASYNPSAQKRQFDFMVKLGGRDLTLYSEQAGGILPTLSPKVRGCPGSPMQQALPCLPGAFLFLVGTCGPRGATQPTSDPRTRTPRWQGGRWEVGGGGGVDRAQGSDWCLGAEEAFFQGRKANAWALNGTCGTYAPGAE
jgi:hypothetical protein